MSVFYDTRAGFNSGNLGYHQSVSEHHSNLVLKSAYLKDVEDVYPFDISGVEIVKESKQIKGRVYVTAVITYKTPSMVNRKPVTVSIALG